jgi:hypothetical protein
MRGSKNNEWEFPGKPADLNGLPRNHRCMEFLCAATRILMVSIMKVNPISPLQECSWPDKAGGKFLRLEERSQQAHANQ